VVVRVRRAHEEAKRGDGAWGREPGTAHFFAGTSRSR
jgi:hypothetical protein